MKRLVTITAICFFLAVTNTASAQAVAKRKNAAYVGEVIIVGNTVTQDRVIRELLQEFQPGQALNYAELPIAEKKLAARGLFRVDPAKKIRPTVQVLDSPGPFKDILVKVEEKPTGRMTLEGHVNVLGQPVVRLMLNEDNFGPLGFPTSLADIAAGRAFRGGGQKVRLELVRLNLMQGRLTFFSDGPWLRAVLQSLWPY